MPKPRGSTLDALSDVSAASSAVQAGGQTPSPAKVRTAQLVLASVAYGDPEREPDLPEVLAAVGLLNRNGKISRRPKYATPSQVGLPRTYRFPGEREPSGRLSRRGRERKKNS